MTDEQLAEIEGRLNAPMMRLWREFLGDEEHSKFTNYYVIGNTFVTLSPGEVTLIARTPADIAALLAEVRRLRVAAIESRNNWLAEMRANSKATMAGNEWAGWWVWRETPPPSRDNFTEICAAVVDALTQEGIPAWPGDGTGCVTQMIQSQLQARLKAEAEVNRLQTENAMLWGRVVNAFVVHGENSDLVHRVDRTLAPAAEAVKP